MDSRLVEVPINAVYPDPNQPRKIFPKSHINGLMESIRTEGLINPIEVDPNYKIITGECRWRAVRGLGWETVTVKIYDTKMTPYERTRRQVAENVHQTASGISAPMNAVDLANAYLSMLRMLGYDWQAGDQIERVDHGIRKLSREIGISHSTILEYLGLLSQPNVVIEDIKKGRARTIYREVDSAPEKYREKLRNTVVKDPLISREDVRRFVRIAKTKPQLAEIALARMAKEQSEQANKILNKAIELSLVLSESHPKKFSPHDEQMVRGQLGSTMGVVRNFLGAMNSVKQLNNGGNERG